MSKKNQEFIVDELLFEFYGDDVPTYVKDAGRDFIKLLVSDFMGTELLRITIADVIKYYYQEARNIVSGCRFLAGHGGDWRQIDALAKECLEFFKCVNRPALIKEGLKFGMELK